MGCFSWQNVLKKTGQANQFDGEMMWTTYLGLDMLFQGFGKFSDIYIMLRGLLFEILVAALGGS